MLVTEKDKIKRFYTALLERDSQYVGVFYVCVKTTGVFCVSTCRARKPKPENVVFCTTSKDALRHGYRPCKVCRPTENVDEPPEEIKTLMRMVSAQPERKLSDGDIRQMGYTPETIRRWFKKHHGLTFQAYQRMIRVNIAFRELKNGTRVTDSAFDSGYESLSGFGAAFKNVFGVAPDDARDRNVIYIHRFTTPLGPMYACATDQGLCLLEFTDRRMLESEFRDLSRRLRAVIISGSNTHLKTTEKQIGEYFEGRRMKFDIPLVTPGTDFQQLVWQKLTEIPYGTTRSYGEQAVTMNRPSAVRAVARANGLNRISIIIPCHRVIGANGQLTGYGGGIARKKWLLDHESKNL
ncbi:bifunctional transcriptional activator/DNA repair enzyme AdaA [Sinomicrobium weinanense]|uniref:Methylated-DNA--protein-cysteine methyltransferase n=1 Tax=Sinomicrobium weinanense TaxID=2842200 RepID=A0A926Q3Z3_9FLAO|nr:methylated-DNA--[protein]-cysteine S-methyltransferase [Sinomicrobium weinanense]MBC9796300.1 bifunctional transcriptional activator/DNA repair protein Ada [Sinomicrobium weinanense]MBU3123219.1 methylated-DNA--[protein]-cysteine S-methyltransferase [Sinomicrobium weinanense]